MVMVFVALSLFVMLERIKETSSIYDFILRLVIIATAWALYDWLKSRAKYTYRGQGVWYSAIIIVIALFVGTILSTLLDITLIRFDVIQSTTLK